MKLATALTIVGLAFAVHAPSATAQVLDLCEDQVPIAFCAVGACDETAVQVRLSSTTRVSIGGGSVLMSFLFNGIDVVELIAYTPNESLTPNGQCQVNAYPTGGT